MNLNNVIQPISSSARCSSLAIYIDDGFIVYAKNTAGLVLQKMEFESVGRLITRNPKIQLIQIFVPVKNDIFHVENSYPLLNKLFYQTRKVLYAINEEEFSNRYTTMNNTIVVYFNPLKPIATYGDAGTFIFTGVLTNNILACNYTTIDIVRPNVCAIELPPNEKPEGFKKIVSIELYDLLNDVNQILTSTNTHFELCSKYPMNDPIIFLNVKRFLLIAQRYRSTALRPLTYNLKASHSQRDFIVNELNFELIRRQCKFYKEYPKSAVTCPNVLTDKLKFINFVRNTLHPSTSERESVSHLFNEYRKTIRYDVVPYLFLVMEKNPFTFQCYNQNYVLHKHGMLPINSGEDIQYKMEYVPMQNAAISSEYLKSGVKVNLFRLKIKNIYFY